MSEQEKQREWRRDPMLGFYRGRLRAHKPDETEWLTLDYLNALEARVHELEAKAANWDRMVEMWEWRGDRDDRMSEVWLEAYAGSRLPREWLVDVLDDALKEASE